MLFASHRPIKLGFWDGELPCVSLRLGTASVVASRVAKDSAWKHNKAFCWGLEIHIPHGLVIENSGELLSQFPCLILLGFELQHRPDVRLIPHRTLCPIFADLEDFEIQVLKIRPGAQAFGYEGALDHQELLEAVVHRVVASA
jgi:hypothetical protein